MKRKLLDEFLKSDFSEIQLPEELSTSFNIIERIGFNEFGETFILSDKNTKEQYVLKMQDCSDVVNGNEKQLLYGLKHIGLPQYKNIIEQNNKQYSIYKYVEGEPLDEYLIDMSSVDTKQVVDNILSLCDVLKYLHSQPEPIIHRDIKPSNIIINIENNSITLIDFGIARKYQEKYRDGHNILWNAQVCSTGTIWICTNRLSYRYILIRCSNAILANRLNRW